MKSLNVKNLLRAATVTVTATVVVGLALTGCTPAATPSGQSQYVAVIDAGSSGSRIYLYQGEATSSSVNVTTLLEFAPKGGSGLSSYQATPTVAGEQGIQPLLNELDTFLAAHNIAHTEVPVYVMATAGMRNVEQAVARVAASIYDSVTTAITADGYATPEVGTIPGSREALYAWTDANYNHGVFAGGTAGTSTSAASAPAKSPIGIVEVGGASSQIAFTTTASGPNVTSVKIAGKDYRVFDASYLGLGQNDARQGILSPADAVSGNACFPNNVGTAVAVAVAGTSGVAAVAGIAVDPAAYDIKNTVAVNAAASSFDFAACQSAYRTYIGSTSTSAFNSASTSKLLPADISRIAGFSDAQFVGLGALNYAMDDFKVMAPANEQMSLTGAVNALCAGPNAWAKVTANFGNKVSDTSENSCANATYNVTWAFSASALNLNPDHFVGAGEINGESLTWTRGVAVLLFAGAL